MKITAVGFTVLALLGAGRDVNAAEQGFYAGTDVSLVDPTVGKSDGINFLTSSGFTHVRPESIQYDDSALGWSAFVGYRLNPHIAAELAYLDFGSIDVQETFELPDAPFPGGPQTRLSSFSLRVSGPMASVMGIIPFSEKFEAFGRAGVLWARQEVQLAPSFSFNDADEQWALGLGLQAHLARGWSARFEYQRFEKTRDTVVSGDLELERFLLGTTYHLGAGDASAPNSSMKAGRAGTGFYAVADVGVTEPAVGKSDGFLIIFSHVPWAIFRATPLSAASDGPAAGGGLALGYRVNRYLAAELAYTDFGEVDIREHYVVGPFGDPFFIPRLDIELALASRVAGPSVNVLGILPVADEFEFFARAGILFASQEVSRRPGDVTATNTEELWIWGAGVDVGITRRWSARFAYENVEELRRTQFTGPIRMERYVFGVIWDF